MTEQHSSFTPSWLFRRVHLNTPALWLFLSFCLLALPLSTVFVHFFCTSQELYCLPLSLFLYERFHSQPLMIREVQWEKLLLYLTPISALKLLSERNKKWKFNSVSNQSRNAPMREKSLRITSLNSRPGKPFFRTNTWQSLRFRNMTLHVSSMSHSKKG